MSKRKTLAIILTLALGAALTAVAQEQKQPSPDEIVDKEIDRLSETLKLEEWQVYYVDSILRHDYFAMMHEMESLQKARVSNSDMYVAVQDKWLEKTQQAYHKYFNEEQWQRYLKQGGQRQINEREKRRAKAAGITNDKKKKK